MSKSTVSAGRATSGRRLDRPRPQAPAQSRFSRTSAKTTAPIVHQRRRGRRSLRRHHRRPPRRQSDPQARPARRTRLTEARASCGPTRHHCSRRRLTPKHRRHHKSRHTSPSDLKNPSALPLGKFPANGALACASRPQPRHAQRLGKPSHRLQPAPHRAGRQPPQTACPPTAPKHPSPPSNPQPPPAHLTRSQRPATQPHPTRHQPNSAPQPQPRARPRTRRPAHTHQPTVTRPQPPFPQTRRWTGATAAHAQGACNPKAT